MEGSCLQALHDIECQQCAERVTDHQELFRLREDGLEHLVEHGVHDTGNGLFIGSVGEGLQHEGWGIDFGGNFYPRWTGNALDARNDENGPLVLEIVRFGRQPKYGMMAGRLVAKAGQ
uniref:Uncharacterized protein n=1 Tax=Anopheles atroparvus TaxID=41427 RepID=A0AAG5D919_ANOAO